MAYRRAFDRPVQVGRSVFWAALLAVNLYTMAASPMRRTKLYALLAVNGLGILAGLFAWAVRERRRRASESWPSAAGIVQSTQVRRDSGSYAGRYALHIEYSFHAGGERYAGSALRIFRGEPEALETAEKLRGATVPVRYNPRDADDSLMA
jgi:Protein of unknown function (DUF3592)